MEDLLSRKRGGLGWAVENGCTPIPLRGKIEPVTQALSIAGAGGPTTRSVHVTGARDHEVECAELSQGFLAS